MAQHTTTPYHPPGAPAKSKLLTTTSGIFNIVIVLVFLDCFALAGSILPGSTSRLSAEVHSYAPVVTFILSIMTAVGFMYLVSGLFGLIDDQAQQVKRLKSQLAARDDEATQR